MASEPVEVRETDEELVRQSASGDRTSFRRLVERYQGAIFGLLVRMVGRHERAEELAQEVFIRVWQSARRFKSGGLAGPWIRSIALNLARNERRDRWRRESGLKELEHVAGSPPADSPEDVLRRERASVAAREALQELGEGFREALILRDLEGLDYPGIAALLGISRGTARTRVYRARERFAAGFTRRVEGEER